MTDWKTLTKEALQNLGAEQVMIPGAKLREHMVKAGYSAGFDVAGYVAKSGTSFSRLVKDIPGVNVEIRPGSDVVIGLDGARDPGHGGLSSSGSGGLRSDVYQAFTRISKVPFVYVPAKDRFLPEHRAEGPSIEVSSPTLDRLISYRNEFIGTLPPEAQQPLRDSLLSANPLSDFRREVTTRGLLDKWVSAQEGNIKEQVIQWAGEHNVTPRDTWFRRLHVSKSPHRTLALLTPFLNDDEIRELRVPIRAVEAMLDDLQK